MRYHQLIVSAIFALALSSCFKDEAPNAECDIIEASLHVDNPTDIFYNPTDTLVRVLYTDDNISFSVRRKADLTALAPTFRITDGATISPASGLFKYRHKAHSSTSCFSCIMYFCILFS